MFAFHRQLDIGWRNGFLRVRLVSQHLLCQLGERLPVSAGSEIIPEMGLDLEDLSLVHALSVEHISHPAIGEVPKLLKKTGEVGG